MSRFKPEGYARLVLHPDGGAMLEDYWYQDPGAYINEDELANDLGKQIRHTDALALAVFAKDGEGFHLVSLLVLQDEYQSVWARHLEGLLAYLEPEDISRELEEWEAFYGVPLRGQADELAG